MKKEHDPGARRRRRTRAFTIIEVMIVVATLALLAGLFLPYFADRNRHKDRARISCVNNLKLVGLSFRIYANDNDDRYPMAVPEAEGGAKEAVARGDLFRVFQVMSNELSVPKTVVCRSELGNRGLYPNDWAQLNNSNISYFVGLDAVDTKPNMILSGDRDIAENGELLTGLANLSTNRPVAWHALLHKEGGNVGLADGSVQQLTTATLLQTLRATGDTTNRVLFPQ